MLATAWRAARRVLQNMVAAGSRSARSSGRETAVYAGIMLSKTHQAAIELDLRLLNLPERSLSLAFIVVRCIVNVAVCICRS